MYMETYTTCNSTISHLSKKILYCTFCDKILNGRGISGNINSRVQRTIVLTVEKKEFDNVEVNLIENSFKDVNKEFNDKHLHASE